MTSWVKTSLLMEDGALVMARGCGTRTQLSLGVNWDGMLGEGMCCCALSFGCLMGLEKVVISLIIGKN